MKQYARLIYRCNTPIVMLSISFSEKYKGKYMKLHHLRYFIAVAEEGHFGRAAERLGIGQPPLSLQIQRLEKQMKIKLFNRRSRGVELTEGGSVLLKHARHILANVDDALSDVQRFRRGECNEINLGFAGGTYFNREIAARLCQFKCNHTELLLKSVLEGHTPDLIRKLLEGTIDAAFIRPLTDTLDGLALTPVLQEPLAVVLPVNHRLALSGGAISLDMLAHEPFVLCERNNIGRMFDTLMAACHQAGFTPVRGQRALQIEAIIPMVSAGFGISVVPGSMRNNLHSGVVFLTIEGQALNTAVILATRHRDASPAIGKLVNSVKNDSAGADKKRKPV